jgi:hypothetical protein
VEVKRISPNRNAIVLKEKDFLLLKPAFDKQGF